MCHYQIRRHGEDAFFSIDDQQPIHGLDTLIQHYQESSHGLVSQLTAMVKCDPPPHNTRSHGRTNLLHRATKEGNLTVVTELLKSGYVRNIDAKNQDGQIAVHLACRYQNEEMIKTLLDNGANVNCRDSDGNTPLHVIIMSFMARGQKDVLFFKFNFHLVRLPHTTINSYKNAFRCESQHSSKKQHHWLRSVTRRR